jgi:hypothetical protein
MQSILHSIIGPSGPETADLTGKVALVTGGPKGIVRVLSLSITLFSVAQRYHCAYYCAAKVTTGIPSLAMVRQDGLPRHHGQP